MKGEKIQRALSGAGGFVREMDPKDWLAWLPFDSKPYLGVQGLKSEVGEELESVIRTTPARGETALYDAIAHAYQILEQGRDRQSDAVRYGMVILSDGRDTKSQTSMALLEAMLRPAESDVAGIQIHTIGVGHEANDQALTKIANITHGRYWDVEDPATIEAVYRRISKYW